MSAPSKSEGTPSTLVALSNELADAVDRASRSIVAIHARRRIPSSGVVWQPGVVVAASHTIRRDDDISLTLPSGETVEAALAGRDPGTDLAVLRVLNGGPDATVATLAPDEALRVGALVLALGRPGTVTASLGVISAVGGPLHTFHGGRVDQIVRLDVAIYDGFSGAPLVDAAGRVVGVNTSAIGRGSPLTIPAVTVSRVVDELLSAGRVKRRTYAGIGVQPVQVPEPLAQKHGLPSGMGLLVVVVEEGGPADKAGIVFGDVLIALDGRPIRDPMDLVVALSAHGDDTSVQIRLLRGGSPTSLSLTPVERPSGGGRRR